MKAQNNIPPGYLPSHRSIIPGRENSPTLFRICAFLLLFAVISCSAPCGAEVISPMTPPGMNLSIDPGDDFFRYTNYYWIADNSVPAGKRFYTAFEEVADLVDGRVKRLARDAAKDYDAEDGSPRQLIGSFYRAAMNDLSNERVGLSPLDDEFAMIDGISDRSELRIAASNLTAHGLDPFFVLYIDENPENRGELIATISEGDITLRHPVFYELEFEVTTRAQDEMRDYVITSLKDIGVDTSDAEQKADAIFRIERRLARSQVPWTATNNTTTNLTEGVYSVTELNSLFPGINWTHLFDISGRPDLEDVYITNPRYVQEVGKVLSTEPVEDLKTYLTWRLLQFAAPFSTPAMQERYYRFYDVDLANRELTPQEDRVLSIMNLYLGNPIAHLYVERYFSEEAKVVATEIIRTIREVMHDRIEELSWMEDETKEIALLKLDLLKEQAGYPDEWGQYKNLTISDHSYLENMLELTDYFTNGSLQLSGEPSNPDVWYTSPHGVAAHYDLVHNRIITPAGFLNPPFFDPNADDAWNYGSFGWVYGHEMIHMIDIGGQQYHPNGKKENWWTDADANNYFRAAWPMIYQINSTEVLPNLTLNGTQMLIETSADLGGLRLAYDAYVRTRQDPEMLDVPGYDGFTDRQRFFIAFAQAQRGNVTEEELRSLTISEDHPWNEFRVNTIPFHFDEFYQAFPVINPNNTLYLYEDERSRLW